MRIAIVADTYPPLRISGAVQMRDLARELVVQGHDPTVIVPSTELDGLLRIERSHRVTVLRCRTPPTKDLGYVRRTINEMRLPYALLRALRASELRDERWDGLIWYSPSIFLAPIIRRLRAASGCRSYLILRDIFPEWAVDMGLMSRGLAYRFFKLVERRQYSVADIIGVQSPANLPYIKAQVGGGAQRLEVLHNWLSEADDIGCTIDLAKTALAGRKVFVYAGNMGVAQGMDRFLDLAERMRQHATVGFLFVGRGSDAARLAATAKAKRLTNVMFHDEIDPSEIPGLLRQCHIGIVALDPRHKTHNIPGKFLTYLQAGMPVLACINPGNDLEKMINDERVGRVCTVNDGVALQALAEELLANPEEMQLMGQRSRALSQRRFSSTAAVQQVVAAILCRHATVPDGVLGRAH